jgi:3-deoxy-D-manno-octulosonate 8-phosphate phosphatase (KDO 8-P phosphatase)
VITGRDSPALRQRIEALGIQHVFYGTENKLPAAEQVLQVLGLGWEACAAMGDDWPDLAVMVRAAFACAPVNAHHEVKSRAAYVTHAMGGFGAAREFCDVLLVASGQYSALLDQVIQGSRDFAGVEDQRL